ncbi:hypothetical protein T02_10887 [Trichinella nativa]|uniref:Uncharacterized protein n=1 Tax=Trichinella nativa TaxID=6335 RepID=A0A0V1LPS3_9BILA|nr:hypothetical protein T02_10887 [Trichinella nativa]
MFHAKLLIRHPKKKQSGKTSIILFAEDNLQGTAIIEDFNLMLPVGTLPGIYRISKCLDNFCLGFWVFPKSFIIFNLNHCTSHCKILDKKQ